MKQSKYSICLASAALLALAGCDKEAQFSMNPGEGQIKRESLSVDYINRGKNTRAEVVVGDFVVNFVNTASNEVARSFKYSEMPEIVALPVGDYRAKAEYGENPIAEWEDPYYTGDTSFAIEDGKVTDDIDPIECTLSNIKITVKVNDFGFGILDDVKVIVSAGEDGKLVYNSSTNDKAGYFRHVDGSKTITAEFIGNVDGVEVDQTVAYNDAAAGNAYNLNFEIKRPDNMEPGSIVITDTGLTLDATITIVDETKEINFDEPDYEIITDDLRPVDGTENGSEGPGSGDESGNDPNDNPDDNPVPATGPSIVPLSPGLEVDQCCEVNECEFKVVSKSESGITGFTIKIESEVLTPEELESIGLTDEFDLINPGEYGPVLKGLGFSVGDEVKGKKECKFSITGFLSLIPGAGDHKFRLTVTDDNGTTTGFIGITTVE